MRALEILLVEDCPGDVRLVREALAQGKNPHRLHVAGDGVAAMEMLTGAGGAGEALQPDLILLDLNMPRMNGRELLAKVKSDRQLRSIPVVVLTTSDSELDVAECYRLHCNCYVTKPVELDAFIEVVRRVGDFWAALVKLPHAQAVGV